MGTAWNGLACCAKIKVARTMGGTEDSIRSVSSRSSDGQHQKVMVQAVDLPPHTFACCTKDFDGSGVDIVVN